MKEFLRVSLHGFASYNMATALLDSDLTEIDVDTDDDVTVINMPARPKSSPDEDTIDSVGMEENGSRYTGLSEPFYETLQRYFSSSRNEGALNSRQIPSSFHK